ncbi:hypothetical protein DWY69_17525 [Eisenbergiella massiliensis]|uniref:Uncharacterized protein n=1 Tax=Eisenbergiella massiliensis TaxID=1720294 RepID=A0A3E3IQU7_9FIRM|nr:hypothetical protein DWY69_17525 [Eisenbergiella massiliensis]
MILFCVKKKKGFIRKGSSQKRQQDYIEIFFIKVIIGIIQGKIGRKSFLGINYRLDNKTVFLV